MPPSRPRAREAGRGFAIVAQEVKALSSQTAKATDEIGTHISDLQRATKESVAAIEGIGGTIVPISEISSGWPPPSRNRMPPPERLRAMFAVGTNSQVATTITQIRDVASQTGADVDWLLATIRAA
jgi:methyl-accepting chemotaxis protein